VVQVGNGATDFSPSPAESRALIQQSYDPAASPLLMVRFGDDSIDETPEMAALLQARHTAGMATCCLVG
jgi:hypothetical protein